MLTFEDCYLHFLEVLNRKSREEVYTPAFRDSLGIEDPLGFIRSLLRGGNGLPPSEKLMTADVQSYLPFNQLAYGDRMSMAQSLEVRVPFVDQQLIQVAGRTEPLVAFPPPQQLILRLLGRKHFEKLKFQQ